MQHFTMERLSATSTLMIHILQRKKQDTHPTISHRYLQLLSMLILTEKTFYWHWRSPIKYSVACQMLHLSENTVLIIPFRVHIVLQPERHGQWDLTAVILPMPSQSPAQAIIHFE